MRVVLLTVAALVGFSANSLLTRGALGAHLLDAGSFTLIRVLTGAITLNVLARLRSSSARESGSWTSAAALVGYAICFTLAYGRIGAGVGALVLFGAVQVTMIGTGLIRGERPGGIDWLGVGLAFSGLLVFAIPGATAPDSLGTTLMIAAGACWGAYSLAGKRSRDPLGATAGNFLRATPVAAVFALALLPESHVTSTGVWLAAASGALASGVGYTIWYTVLPALTAWRAAIVQLVVPVLTAIAATLMLGESITSRLAVAALLVATGVAMTIRRK